MCQVELKEGQAGIQAKRGKTRFKERFMKFLFAALLVISIFLLPSCGDDLCERASDKLNECSGYTFELCRAISDCGECRTEGRAYAKCIVEADTCADITNDCDTEGAEWATCVMDCY